jgi:alkylhydroperoxidase family enzyme
MARINVVDPAAATGEARALLDGMQGRFGAVPHFIRALANSPTALSVFLGLYRPLSAGAIDGATQERIAAAAAAFAGTLNGQRGEVTIRDLDALRAAGFSEDEIIEIVALVALNEITQLLGKSTSIPGDFPQVDSLRKK